MNGKHFILALFVSFVIFSAWFLSWAYSYDAKCKALGGTWIRDAGCVELKKIKVE